LIAAVAGGVPLYPFVSGSGHAAAEWRDDTHFAILRLILRERVFVADFVAQDGALLRSETFSVRAAT
jgi:hypothetical protein